MEGLLANKTTCQPERFCISMHVAQVKGKAESPMCGARETVFLALHGCTFYARTHRFMVECFGEWRVKGKIGHWTHFPGEHMFNTTPRVVLLTARKAH